MFTVFSMYYVGTGSAWEGPKRKDSGMLKPPFRSFFFFHRARNFFFFFYFSVTLAPIIHTVRGWRPVEVLDGVIRMVLVDTEYGTEREYETIYLVLCAIRREFFF